MVKPDYLAIIAKAKAAAAEGLPQPERLPFLVPGQVHVVKIKEVIKALYHTPLVIVESLSLADGKDYRLPGTTARIALKAKALTAGRFGVVVATDIRAKGPICGFTSLSSEDEAKGIVAHLRALTGKDRTSEQPRDKRTVCT